jgi:hypothetical protein
MKATSISINLKLPCNARCPFCISRTTVKPDSVIAGGSDGYYARVQNALRYAAYHGIDTCLITSTGEPLLDTELVGDVGRAARKAGIPIVELQTNGFLMSDYLPATEVVAVQELTRLGITAVAISIAARSPRLSAETMGLPEDYDYRKVVKAVVGAGLLCRVTYNIGADCPVPGSLSLDVEEFLNIGVHQLTLRQLGVPEVKKTTEAAERVVKWVENHQYQWRWDALRSEVVRNGTKLRPLPHGDWVYDYHGISLVLASCMTETRSEEVRSLILQPDGHLYHSWNYRGSILL